MYIIGIIIFPGHVFCVSSGISLGLGSISRCRGSILFSRGHPARQFSGEGGLSSVEREPKASGVPSLVQAHSPSAFLLSLPLINPIVHGDGVGYYAYARAPLIEHSFHFEEDWRHANLYFSQSRTRPDGQLLPEQYTETGYVSNLFTIGPALLWFPFSFSLTFSFCF